MPHLHFGAGSNILDGWQNYDIDLDVRKLPLPFPDNYADASFTCHMPEHLSMPDCLRFFKDVYRILKPSGYFRVCVPTVGTHLTREHAADLLTNHGHLIGFTPSLLMTVLWCAGFDMDSINETGRSPLDGHFRVIGIEKDDLETCRIEATK
jgi:hypothetical protein